MLLTSFSGFVLADTESKKANDLVNTTNWQQLSAEQRMDILKSYQVLHQLDDKDRQNLQQQLDWFSQLSRQQQQRMREAWQNMSESEREYWKAQLKSASVEDRNEIREKILDKYD